LSWNAILPVVLYGCGTWSLTFNEEHRLGVFENRVLSRIFGPKKDEVTGERRRLHSEELHILYSSPNLLGRSNQRRHVARKRMERKVSKGLVEKPERKRPLGKPRHRREDRIRMDLRENGWGV
jgi:hypothetical protein